MKWIKEVIVDIGITLAIILAVLSTVTWLKYVILFYSLLMLFLKGVTLTNRSILKRIKRSDAPPWIFHVLYGINVVVLLVFQWWLIAIIWMGVWGLSYMALRKAEEI